MENKKCFLFEGVNYSHLSDFFYYYVKDFEFREISTFISRKAEFNVPAQIFQEDNCRTFLNNLLISSLSNLIVFQKLKALNIIPDIVGAYSLGIYGALCAVGSIGLKECIDLMKKIHAYLMDRFSDRVYLSVLIDIPSILQLRKQLMLKSKEDLPMYISAVNHSRQVIITGPEECINRVFKYFFRKKPETKQILHLPYPLHTPYLYRFKWDLHDIIKNADIADPKIPLINTISQASITSKAELISYFLKNFYSPVHWHNSIDNFKTGTLFYNIGTVDYLIEISGSIDRRIRHTGLKDLL